MATTGSFDLIKKKKKTFSLIISMRSRGALRRFAANDSL